MIVGEQHVQGGACIRFRPSLSRFFPPSPGFGILVLAGVLILAIGAPAAAPPDRLVFERMGRERGFPGETITAIVRDRTGFLWAGTREGLAVYDGYDVRVLQHSVSDPTSLSDDTVRRIYEDRSGGLWVGTDGGGLQRLDRASWRFQSFLGHESVYAMVDGNDGALWVGTQKGLVRIDPASGALERLDVGLPAPWVFDLHCDPAGRIWLATVGGGVAWLDPASRRITRVPFAPDAASPRSVNVFSIAESGKGELWFGADDGIFRYDASRSLLVRAPVAEIQSESKPAIATSMAFDHGGTLWIATWNKGLVAFDEASGASRSYRHEAGREDALATDRLTSVFVDASGDAWIGSWGQGLYRFSTEAGAFSRILDRRSDPEGLPYHEVTSILESRSGQLWVGTWGEGLCWRAGRAGPFTRVEPPGSFEDMSTPLALAEAADGSIWTGTMAGLFEVGRDGKVRRAYNRSAKEPDGVSITYVNALVLDPAGRLWIGTGESGLLRLETDRATFVRFRNDPQDAASLSDDVVNTLMLDSRGRLWVGTRAGGINVLDAATGKFTRLTPDPHDPRSLPHHTVTAIYEDRRGRVWAGTGGGGLARVEGDAATGWSVTRVGVSDGLVNGSVLSIREDDDGSLWIGTRRGLSRYEPGSGRFHNYGSGDGLPSLEFRANAAATGPHALHFGTLGGILSVARGSRFTTPAPTPTVITAIRTHEGPWVGADPPWKAREIDVPYGTMLSLEFGVLDLSPPHRFMYRLAGESDAWIDLGARREITFAQLRPGSYALSVRGLSARGVWSESSSPLKVSVLPPFWMTWWFRSALALATVAGAWTWVHLRLNTLARRNKSLEALHRDREAALEQARSSQQELHGAYARLRDLTRRLEDAKEEERRRIARELHDEMGQALSAVKLNLKVLGRLSVDAAATERVGDALSLVDGIIGHVRALSLDLRPPLLDELGLVVALRGYAEGQSVRSGVPIAVEANADAGDIPADIAIAAFRIVQESIHNVLRHAGASSITVSVRRDPKRLSLAVRDDGRGFDLAGALDRAATGRHLGLLGMRERVEALAGSFEIETEPGRGTSVHADIPLKESPVPA
jgi:signal transduction histidine kinase/ligand-binding sensor domain-containing protein